MSKNTAIEILNCMGTVLETRDSNELKNKYFSLMADKSTNIKNVCEMTIIISFVTDCGEIKELFFMHCRIIWHKCGNYNRNY
jgi:hypothetical protein